MSWVYILENSEGKYYVGSTVDLESRIKHHHGGDTPSTKRLGKMLLVFQQKYSTIDEARKVERRLKSLKRKDYIGRIVRDGFIKYRP
ncbi:MAG: GIY-YIG nuclease family protein [Candidatus Vogelbacteria bacterium]